MLLERIAETAGFILEKWVGQTSIRPIALYRFHRDTGKLVDLDVNDEESCFQFILF
jgi:hypothetical protein